MRTAAVARMRASLVREVKHLWASLCDRNNQCMLGLGFLFAAGTVATGIMALHHDSMLAFKGSSFATCGSSLSNWRVLTLALLSAMFLFSSMLTLGEVANLSYFRQTTFALRQAKQWAVAWGSLAVISSAIGAWLLKAWC